MDSILARVGSDASYDLIMEAFPKNGEAECLLFSTDEEFVTRSGEILEYLKERVRKEGTFSLRVHLFQRFPDLWVWSARFDALLEKVSRKANGEDLPWL